MYGPIHLVGFHGKGRYRYTIHGCYGIPIFNQSIGGELPSNPGKTSTKTSSGFASMPPMFWFASPIPSMGHGIFTLHEWLIFMVNVRRYTYHTMDGMGLERQKIQDLPEDKEANPRMLQKPSQNKPNISEYHGKQKHIWISAFSETFGFQPVFGDILTKVEGVLQDVTSRCLKIRFFFTEINHGEVFQTEFLKDSGCFCQPERRPPPVLNNSCVRLSSNHLLFDLSLLNENKRHDSSAQNLHF